MKTADSTEVWVGLISFPARIGYGDTFVRMGNTREIEAFLLRPRIQYSCRTELFDSGRYLDRKKAGEDSPKESVFNV